MHPFRPYVAHMKPHILWCFGSTFWEFASGLKILISTPAINHPFNKTFLVFADFFTVNAHHMQTGQGFSLTLTTDFTNLWKHGRPQNFFPRGGKIDILLILFRFLTMQRKRTYTKRFNLNTPQRKCSMLRQKVANSAPSKTWFSTFFMQRSILQPNLTWRPPSENFQ